MQWLWLAAASVWLVAAPSPTPVSAPKTAFEYAQAAREAHRRGDMAAFLRNSEEASRRRPGDVWMLYNLACARARNGQARAALEALEGYAAHRAAADLEYDTDFDSIRGEPGYRDVLAKMAELRSRRITSGAAAAFTIPEKGLVPEGVAHDSVTGAFFVSSIRQRKILRVGSDGRATEFVSPARDGLRSATGMAVDVRRRTLWVASSALPHMNGFHKGDPPASAVFEYDVDSGRLRGEHRPPDAGKPAAFDDLTVAPDGRVFVNDGQSPRVFTLAPGERALEVFVESDAMRGTQGLAVAPDGKTLYASDYNGLVAIDLATRSVTPIAVPPNLALNGIDGLAYAPGRSLVAIQNGIEPARVIRLWLSEDGRGIRRSEILEMNHPAFAEPTLGVVVGERLYFTANSQGGRFLDEKHPIPESEMQEAVVLSLPLSPAPP